MTGGSGASRRARRQGDRACRVICGLGSNVLSSFRPRVTSPSRSGYRLTTVPAGRNAPNIAIHPNFAGSLKLTFGGPAKLEAWEGLRLFRAASPRFRRTGQIDPLAAVLHRSRYGSVAPGAALGNSLHRPSRALGPRSSPRGGSAVRSTSDRVPACGSPPTPRSDQTRPGPEIVPAAILGDQHVGLLRPPAAALVRKNR